ncbi:unnamed protein product [Mesocestoides corti]|uniref:EML-like second beta-propeller domain-containing protein n=5 Tax=Mesocestoides corti TaxID=53468 RepID=A0A0R3U5Q3_MESCO|nr:unnamed protein product [Mesocestoides corti]
MAISPNRRYIALAEKTDDGPCIVIYDLASLRRKKVLRGTGINSDEFKSVSFSPDSHYLVAQGGEPDWALIYWNWEKPKRLSTVRTSQGNPIYQVVEPQNFLCHTWVTDERIAVGTAKGSWILIHNGEPLEEYIINLDLPQDAEQMDDKESSVSSEYPAVTTECTSAITCTQNFVYVACGPGLVHCFKYNSDIDKKDSMKQSRRIKPGSTNSGEMSYYRRVKEIRIPNDPNISTDTGTSSNQLITQLSINPSEETLVASTASHQLYVYSLTAPDLGISNKKDIKTLSEKPSKAKTADQQDENKQSENSDVKIDYFRLMSQSFHEGQIIGLDICSRKPLIATCATDRTIRIWNFELNNLELYKEFAEEAYSISLHPLGHFILVGFSDKLRLMNLLIDEIRPVKEFPIRGCKECAFSNGGHLFAAVQGNNIQLYSTTSFLCVNSLKAHNGKIRCLLWSADDNKLISCGMDGAVYEWDPYTGRRINENVLKSCSYNCVTCTEDAKTIYAVGSDRKVKEIAESAITLEVDSGDMLQTSIALSRSGHMLFCGGQEGHVRSYRFPFSNHNVWEDYVGHFGPIVKMQITLNDEFLVTASDDGSIMVWIIQERDGRSVKIERDVPWAEEVLITRSDLEEKNLIMSELRTRVDELKMENEYQLRLKDMNYSERIKELTEKFVKEMEALRLKNQTLRTEKEREAARHSEEMQEIMELHTRELKDLEVTSSHQLNIEVEKNTELQEKAQKMQESYESQISEMNSAKEKILEELTVFFENKLNEKTQMMESLKKENREQVVEHEVTKRLIEEDADREILDLKTQYERRLRDERDANARLRGESGIMKKKFASLQKEIEENMEELRKSHGETQKLNNVIRGQEKDIQGLKKEIQERDETIQDKEKRIYDLKRKNQELEKYKFVLTYKITELKKQIEPRENDIKNYKEQIQEMEGELERFNLQNGALDLNMVDLKEKLKATVGELKTERQINRNIHAIVRRFRIDLYNVTAKIQDPKALKEGILELYQKHIQNDLVSEATPNEEMQREFARQREHLEHTLAGVRQKLAKDAEIHRAEYIRIMHENMSLIEEINKMRIELRNSRNRIRDLEATMGINRKQGKRAREILEKITGHRPNPVIVQELAEANRALHEQSHFMHLLQDKLRLGPSACADTNNAAVVETPLSTSNTFPSSLPPLQPAGAIRPSSDPGIQEDTSRKPVKARSIV